MVIPHDLPHNFHNKSHLVCRFVQQQVVQSGDGQCWLYSTLELKYGKIAVQPKPNFHFIKLLEFFKYLASNYNSRNSYISKLND